MRAGYAADCRGDRRVSLGRTIGGRGSRPAASQGANRVCRLGYLGTAYGALLRGGFRPSQSILVNGATGVLGVGAVPLGIALGASRVVCVGRKERVLARLQEIHPRRIVTVVRRKDGSDAARIAEAAAGATEKPC